MGILSSLLGIGQSAPTPVAPQTIQTTELAKEVAPFMKDLLEKGQALYKTRTDEGFQPYTGQTLAELSPEQIQAREGLTGLVGTQAPQFARAQELTEGVAQQLTPELTQQYMSPYQQAVTDLDKAEAQKTFERDVLPKVRQAQIGAGAFGGTRGTMLEAQALADQQKLLGDIQTRGSQAAYQDAVQAFQAQKQREGATGQALANLAPAAFRAQTGELGLLETIGKEDQQRSQQALDEAYRQYLEERVFPEQTLGQYQSVIAGFPSASVTRTTTTAPQQPQQSGLGSLLGGALNLGNIYGTFGGFTDGGFGSAYTPRGRKAGGLVIDRAFGGQIGEGGFLGMTSNGQNLWQRTQEGISNRSIHGGVLEGEGTSQQTLDTMSQVTPSVQSISVSPLSKTATGALADVESVQQRGGVYNASEFRDAGSTLPRPGDAPETIIQQGQPQVGSMYRDPVTGRIPYALYNPQPINTFGQGYDLKDVDYFTANQLALNEGAQRFMYNDEYAAVDPGLLSNYDYSNLGTKPWGASIVREKIANETFGGKRDRSGNLMPVSSSDREDARKIAEGFTRDRSGRLTIPGTSRAEKFRQLQADGIDMSNPYTRQMHGFKHGGLVDLPVVKRQTGDQVFTLPQGPTGTIGDLTLEQIGQLPLDQQRQFLTENLYNIYGADAARTADEKKLIEADIANQQRMIKEDKDARKSAAIGNMLGSFAKGMQTRSGQGFGQEILGGLEGAATTSTEISKEDRKAMTDAEKELAKNKKIAAKEWDKGNKDKALQLLNIANTNYELKLKELQVGYNKLNARNEAITQLANLYGTAKDSVFNEMANNYIQNGLFKDMAEVNKIIKNEVQAAGVTEENKDDSVLTNTETKKDNNIKVEPLPEIEMFKFNK
jgi:hypothetical protein